MRSTRSRCGWRRRASVATRCRSRTGGFISPDAASAGGNKRTQLLRALRIVCDVNFIMANKLIILADLGELKAYKLTRDELDTTPRLELVETFNTLDGHGRIVDKVS